MQKNFLKFRKVFTNITCYPLILIANNSELVAKYLPNDFEKSITKLERNTINDDFVRGFDFKQEKKSNEMIALLEENNKLLTSIKDSSPTFLNANNTNVQNNPSEQTIVMDSQIVDGFHSQVIRNQYG